MLPNRMPSLRLLAPAFLLIVHSLVERADPAEFLAIDGQFTAYAVSESGTVVGEVHGTGGAAWTRETGVFIPYEQLVSGDLVWGRITAITGDSTTMVGGKRFIDPIDFELKNTFYRFSNQSVLQLAHPASFNDGASANSVSRDGLVVGGFARHTTTPGDYWDQAVYWDNDGEVFVIDGDGFTPTNVSSVSGDGSVIVGGAEAGPSPLPGRSAFRWTPETNAQLLPGWSLDELEIGAFDVSADGRWTVGRSLGANPLLHQALIWEEFSEPRPLMPAHEGWGSRALRVSDDGRVIAGEVYPSEVVVDKLAAVWTEATDFVPLPDLLTNEYGLGHEIAGWDLQFLIDMSEDGRFILGQGFNPQGARQNFLVDFGVSDILPGDYNNNGLVEQADLDLVLGNWGADADAVPDTWTNDLPTGNIDQGELDRVLANWGNSTAPTVGTAGTVPEPATAVLLLIGMAGMLRWGTHPSRTKAQSGLTNGVGSRFSAESG